MSILLHPYQPFPKPLPPVPSENLGPFCLEIDGKWIPYLLGAISALAVEQSWQSDVFRSSGEARNLLSEFARAVACATPGPNGIEMECEMGCCIRVFNGVLQVFSCGEWQDVPGGNIKEIAAGAGQPAQDTPQPGAGECESFIGKVLFFGRWLLPVPVSEGDVITVTNALGAATDYIIDFPEWRCADGTLFIAGGCVNGTAIFDGGDPDPSIHHGNLIAFDGTNYYDCGNAANSMTATITIPSGVTNANLVFMLNYAGPAGAGDCTFDVRICKASENVERFTHIFDLRTGLHGMSITLVGATAPLSSWVAGVGVQVDNPSGLSGQGSMRVGRTSPRTLHNVTLQAVVDSPTDLVGANGVYNMPTSDPLQGSPSEYYIDVASGPHNFSHAFAFTSDAFMAQYNATPHPSTSTIIQMIISADGSDPF
jgi:hypothetical protein